MLVSLPRMVCCVDVRGYVDDVYGDVRWESRRHYALRKVGYVAQQKRTRNAAEIYEDFCFAKSKLNYASVGLLGSDDED